MYRMIAIDMDGTLLGKEQTISPANQEAIRQAIEKGIHVVTATGRSITGMRPYHQQLGLYHKDAYSVTCTGGYVSNNLQTRILHKARIEPCYLDQIHHLCQQLDIDFNYYTQDALCCTRRTYSSKIDALINQMELIVRPYELLEKSDILKITLINEDRTVQDASIAMFPRVAKTQEEARLEEDYPPLRSEDRLRPELFDNLDFIPLELRERLDFMKTTPYHMEILQAGTNKGHGVRLVAQSLGLDMKEVICIGDSMNDYHMLKDAGLGIAMKGAPSALIEVADTVTVSQEEDGVARAMEAYLL